MHTGSKQRMLVTPAEEQCVRWSHMTSRPRDNHGVPYLFLLFVLFLFFRFALAVLAAEPHAVLPIGLIGLLSSDRLPNAHLGVTSAIFKVPLLRQVWSWLQLVPANKSDLTALLQAGRSIALVPGGVQECLHIEHGTEVSVTLEGLKRF